MTDDKRRRPTDPPDAARPDIEQPAVDRPQVGQLQPDDPSVSRPRLPRSFLGRVAYDVLGRWGARLGLAWVVLLVLAAVFAPLIANSHPILWQARIDTDQPMAELQAGVVFARGPVDEQTGLQQVVSSPLLGYLTAVDITLGVALVVAGGLLLIRLPLRMRGLIWIGIVGAAAVIAWLTVAPPENDTLSFYREVEAAGQVDWVVRTPIGYSPNDRQRDVLGLTQLDPRHNPPSARHWMGTTGQGADVFSRMIHASRIALTIGLIATGIAASIGIVVGGVMGYFAGRVDLLGMRAVEIFSAIPVIFLLIMIVAFYGRSLYLMTVVLGLTGWVGYALYVRAEFLKIRQMDYVQAARAAAIPLRSILFRHMLPNGITPVLVLASFGIASMILAESTLSFLGLGLVDDPSWGQMLNEARTFPEQWGLVVFPGLAIFLTVFAYNLVGEALRDAIDPHSQRAAQM